MVHHRFGSRNASTSKGFHLPGQVLSHQQAIDASHAGSSFDGDVRVSLQTGLPTDLGFHYAHVSFSFIAMYGTHLLNNQLANWHALGA